jgi:hypothetical protein
MLTAGRELQGERRATVQLTAPGLEAAHQLHTNEPSAAS